MHLSSSSSSSNSHPLTLLRAKPRLIINPSSGNKSDLLLSIDLFFILFCTLISSIFFCFNRRFSKSYLGAIDEILKRKSSWEVMLDRASKLCPILWSDNDEEDSPSPLLKLFTQERGRRMYNGFISFSKAKNERL